MIVAVLKMLSPVVVQHDLYLSIGEVETVLHAEVQRIELQMYLVEVDIYRWYREAASLHQEQHLQWEVPENVFSKIEKKLIDVQLVQSQCQVVQASDVDIVFF